VFESGSISTAVVGGVAPNAISNMILRNSTSGGGFNGISCQTNGFVEIRNTTIENVNTYNSNATTATNIYGIARTTASGGSFTAIGNTISNCTANCASTGQTQEVVGIHNTITVGNEIFTGNTITGLSNLSTRVNATNILVGIQCNAPTSGTNSVSNNFIHLTPSGATTSVVYGIKIATGATTYANNIISIGGTTPTTIYGIYETGAASNNNNLYFNTVSIYGTPSGAANSYALWSNASTNTRNFQNNIFSNTRTTNGSHYSAYFNYGVNTNLTLNNNDYFASGSGGVLGRYNGGNITTGTIIVTGKDAMSLSQDPAFTTPEGTLAVDYKFTASKLNGTTIAAVTEDYGSIARTAVPNMGAWEFSGPNMWKGTASSAVSSLATNWTSCTVLAADADLIFDAVALNHCILDAAHSVTNITNSSAKNLDVNGQTLTVKGALSFTSTGIIDASTITPSTLNFAGAVAQSIPSGVFLNNKVYDLTINNVSNVTLYGSLNLLNTLTATSGRLNAFAQTPTFIYGGSTAQTIGAQFVDNKIYNLTIDGGVSLSPDSSFTVTNTLLVNSGKQLIIPVNKLLKVDGTVTNDGGTSGIWIKSKTATGSTDANGSFIFPQSSTVLATVEMFSEASWNLENPAGQKYKWQFFGIPISDAMAGSFFYGSYVRKHNEDGIGVGTAALPTKNWWQLQNYDRLAPFNGYEVVYSVPKVYTFYGQLVNNNFSKSLSFTSPGSDYPGSHILSNPYTAAIDIKEIVFGTNVDQTVYLYNAGTLSNWSGNVGSSGNAAGQYMAAPKNTAGTAGIPRQIPSMQGYEVDVIADGNDANATISIPYPAATSSAFGRNVDAQRAPSARRASAAEGIESYTVVDLQGDKSGDKMWLFTVPGTSAAFDNGWDGRKMIGSALVPQLYAKGSDGDYQISTVSNINNTDIAFKASETGNYKLTFTHHNLFAKYPELYLFDKTTNAVTDISNDSASYTFEANAMDQAEARFRIVTEIALSTNVDAQSQQHLNVFSSKETVFVKNKTGGMGRMSLYNVKGVCVLQKTFAPMSVTAINTNLVPGDYVAIIKNDKEKVTRKIVIQ